jgi:hypothetical protein
VEAALIGATGQYVYGILDSNKLRKFTDDTFNHFAVNTDADYISGFHHRYKGGHDLLIDIPNTFINKGFSDAINHAGHVILTDFTTKAGIPIPGFSQSGLGSIMEDFGISKGWMSINIMDGAVGFVAFSEGYSDLEKSFSTDMNMNTFVFFDTYVEGSVEIALSMISSNPILFAAGLENIFSGIISTIKTISVHIDPVSFFGSALSSAIVGAGFSLIFSSEYKIQNVLSSSARASSVGSMFAISPFFGFGLILGYSAHQLGIFLSARDNKSKDLNIFINKSVFQNILKELKKESSFESIWKSMNNVVSIKDGYDLIEKEECKFIKTQVIDSKLNLFNFNVTTIKN